MLLKTGKRNLKVGHNEPGWPASKYVVLVFSKTSQLGPVTEKDDLGLGCVFPLTRQINPT